MTGIEGKSAVVTGSTQGIGRAIARALAERGAAVMVSSRDAGRVEETVAALSTETRGRIRGAACDVRDHASVRAMIAGAEKNLPGIDILVCNAGVGYFGNVAEMPVDAWRETIETNLSGLFYCAREAIPAMRRRGGGYIINIGSLAGKNAFPGGAAYNASKFGLIGFSEALMQEVRYDHIRVSYVMPGSVDTAFGSNEPGSPGAAWKLRPDDVATVVIGLLEMDPRALPSRVELRPSEPKK